MVKHDLQAHDGCYDGMQLKYVQGISALERRRDRPVVDLDGPIASVSIRSTHAQSRTHAEAVLVPAPTTRIGSYYMVALPLRSSMLKIYLVLLPAPQAKVTMRVRVS